MRVLLLKGDQSVQAAFSAIDLDLSIRVLIVKLTDGQPLSIHHILLPQESHIYSPIGPQASKTLQPRSP